MTTNIAPVFVDTNVLTRATVTSAPMHEETVTVLKNLRAEETELWISQQVIREYIANATRPQTYSQPIAIELVLDQVSRFRAQFEVAEDTNDVLERLLILLKETPTGGKQIHDANIVATMLAYDIPRLLTYNVDDFRRFESVITILPLAEST